MNKKLLALPVLVLILSALSGCTEPPAEERESHTTTTPTTTIEEGSETETIDASLFNESQLEELEEELAALEEELKNLEETEELDITEL